MDYNFGHQMNLLTQRVVQSIGTALVEEIPPRLLYDREVNRQSFLALKYYVALSLLASGFTARHMQGFDPTEAIVAGMVRVGFKNVNFILSIERLELTD